MSAPTLIELRSNSSEDNGRFSARPEGNAKFLPELEFANPEELASVMNKIEAAQGVSYPFPEAVHDDLLRSCTFLENANESGKMFSTIQQIMLIVADDNKLFYDHAIRMVPTAKALAESYCKLNLVSGYEARYVIAMAQITVLLHDIGKVFVPNRIKDSPLPLDEVDKTEMHSHPLKSWQIIQALPVLAKEPDLLDGILYHHQKNGEESKKFNYPEKEMYGNEVPFYARIAAIVDVLDILSSPARPYDTRNFPRNIRYAIEKLNSKEETPAFFNETLIKALISLPEERKQALHIIKIVDLANIPNPRDQIVQLPNSNLNY